MANPSTKRPYALICRQPPHIGTASLGHFTDYVERYRHSTRWMGGFWEATWSFIPSEENGLTAAYLRDWFENRLMFRHEERSGGIVSWEGVIWTMVLTLDGVRKERSVGDVFNAIKSTFIDGTGASDQTSYYTNQNSINRYGRRDLVIPLSGVSSSEAAARCQKELVETAEAWPRIIGINPTWPDKLDVTAVGDIFTANNRVTTVPTGSTYDAWVTDLVTNKCEFLSVGGIKANSLVPTDLRIATRVWDVLLDLAEFGDGTDPWRLWCDANSRIWYQPAENTVLYEYHGRNKGLTDTEGNKNPWLVKPGVVRDVTNHRKTIPIPGSFLADGRDSWVLEVEMADGWTEPQLKPAGVSAEEIQSKAEMYQMWLEREAV